MAAAAERRDVQALAAADPQTLYSPKAREILQAIQHMQHEVKALKKEGKPATGELEAQIIDSQNADPSSPLGRLRAEPQAMHLCAILREKPSLVVGPLLYQLEQVHGPLFDFLHAHRQAFAATVTEAVPLVVHDGVALQGVLTGYSQYLEKARAKMKVGETGTRVSLPKRARGSLMRAFRDVNRDVE